MYDKEKKMYRSEEYDICGTKGVLYWKIDNEILNEAYIVLKLAIKNYRQNRMKRLLLI